MRGATTISSSRPAHGALAMDGDAVQSHGRRENYMNIQYFLHLHRFRECRMSWLFCARWFVDGFERTNQEVGADACFEDGSLSAHVLQWHGGVSDHGV